MSAQEIISEIEKLPLEELRQVKEKVEALAARKAETRQTPIWEVLENWAGKAEGLPPDFAENHDHYVHGAPKRNL